jgi:hypothetical protein
MTLLRWALRSALRRTWRRCASTVATHAHSLRLTALHQEQALVGSEADRLGNSEFAPHEIGSLTIAEVAVYIVNLPLHPARLLKSRRRHDPHADLCRQATLSQGRPDRTMPKFVHSTGDHDGVHIGDAAVENDCLDRRPSHTFRATKVPAHLTHVVEPVSGCCRRDI